MPLVAILGEDAQVLADKLTALALTDLEPVLAEHLLIVISQSQHVQVFEPGGDIPQVVTGRSAEVDRMAAVLAEY